MLDDIPQCVPMEIKPTSLSFDDYEIRWHDDGLSIKQVINKQAGAVEFVGVQVDEHSGFTVGKSVQIHTNIV